MHLSVSWVCFGVISLHLLCCNSTFFFLFCRECRKLGQGCWWIQTSVSKNKRTIHRLYLTFSTGTTPVLKNHRALNTWRKQLQQHIQVRNSLFVGDACFFCMLYLFFVTVWKYFDTFILRTSFLLNWLKWFFLFIVVYRKKLNPYSYAFMCILGSCEYIFGEFVLTLKSEVQLYLAKAKKVIYGRLKVRKVVCKYI